MEFKGIGAGVDYTQMGIRIRKIEGTIKENRINQKKLLTGSDRWV